MSFATRHNKKGVDWEVNTEGFEYKTREELYKKKAEAVYQVRGFYINTKGRFGEHPVMISDKFFIDLPDYMTDEIKETLKSEEDIDEIKKGTVGAKIVEFTDKNFGRTCYGIEWVEILEK